MQEQKSDFISQPSSSHFTPQIYEGFKNLNIQIFDGDKPSSLAQWCYASHS